MRREGERNGNGTDPKRQSHPIYITNRLTFYVGTRVLVGISDRSYGQSVHMWITKEMESDAGVIIERKTRIKFSNKN